MKDKKNDGFSADKNKKGDNRLSPFCVLIKLSSKKGIPVFPITPLNYKKYLYPNKTGLFF
jgi:hypothetical protein|nr:MAG TPA: hypothetical protein [Caudoviricetes sp.]